MSKSAIVFISDIHYCEDTTQSQFRENDDNEYYQKWENCIADIEKRQDVQVKYLVISGDLVETGKRKEYRKLRNILDKFCNKFQILKENILIIPGNHDINRSSLEAYCDKNDVDESKASTLYKEKLDNYIDFYKEFKGKDDFNASNAILDSIEIEEEGVLILGLNSLVKESYLTHVGYVDVQKLNKEIKRYLSDEKNIFVVTHHSFTDTRDRELATIENADSLKEALGIMDINTFIYGHHHTSESKKDVIGEQEDTLRYIEIGSIGKILSNNNGESYNNRFTIAICESGKFSIHDYNYTGGEWEERNNRKYLRELSIVPRIKKLTDEGEIKELPRARVDSSLENQMSSKSEIYIYEKSKFLFEYLKKDGNYKEGHFHWKNKKKTLGWINIASFLGNIDILEKIKESIIDIYEQNMSDISVAVGYGMEGNIIGSSLVDYWVENNIGYYFYPSVHKDNEHIDLEKSLWNEYNEYGSVLIICDIMPPEEYLIEIMKSNTKLEACSKIYVLSLFTNFNLLNHDEGNALGKEIKRYTLAEFNVPVCEKDEEECLVCKQNLSKIYLL